MTDPRELSPLASLRLWRHAGVGRAVCRGQIQLRLRGTVTIQGRSSIGLRLLSSSTPRNAITVIDVSAGGRLELDGAVIGRGAVLSVANGAKLSIGRGSYITDGSRIHAGKEISIGERCAISWGVTLLDDDGHGFGPPPYSAPIRIGNEVWIGCNVSSLRA